MKTLMKDRMRQLRGTVSQKDFASKIGVNPNTLRAYEDGRSLPNSNVISAICNEFDVTADWLIFGDGPKQRGTPTQEPEAKQSSGACTRCAELTEKLLELGEENRQLLKENGNLRVELVEARARAAPAEDTQRGAKRNVA